MLRVAVQARRRDTACGGLPETLSVMQGVGSKQLPLVGLLHGRPRDRCRPMTSSSIMAAGSARR